MSTDVTLSASTRTFASQGVGTTSAAQAVTLSNYGVAALNIASIVASGDFAHTTTCSSTLAVGANCSISVSFSPTVLGARSGSVVINSDAANSPATVTLSGTGIVSPVVSLNPTSLTFNNQAVGSTSAAQTVTLTNTGGVTLIISGIARNNSVYGVTDNCGGGLSAGGSCTLNVTYSPTSAVSTLSSITITSNAPGSPHSVVINGNGVPPAAPVCTLTASPTTVPKNGASVLTSNCTNSPTSYSWTGGTCAGTTAATCTVNPAATTTYGVTGTNSAGSGAASATVTVRTIDLTPILMLLLD